MYCLYMDPANEMETETEYDPSGCPGVKWSAIGDAPAGKVFACSGDHSMRVDGYRSEKVALAAVKALAIEGFRPCDTAGCDTCADRN